MNKMIPVLGISASMLLISCDKDGAGPTPSPFTQEHMALQSQTVKIKAEEWEPFGVPGDDTHGYAATANVHVIDHHINANGVVRVQMQRSFNAWIELPITMAEGGPKNMNWRFDHKPGQIRIIIDRNGAAVEPPEEMLVFRVSAGAQ